MTAFRKLLVPLILFCLAGLLRSGGMAAPQEPTDTPTTLITGLTDYVIVPQRIYTVFNPGCAPFLLQSPGEIELSLRLAQPDAPDTLVYQTIQRTAIQGAAARLIYRNVYDDACLNPADYPDIVSDITADEEYVYWLSRDMAGLVKISVDAQTFSDSPSLVATRPVLDSELVNVGEYIYQLNTGIGGTGLYRIHKVSGAVTPLLNSAQVGTTAYDFKTDGFYLYWRADAARVLKSYRLATGTFDDFLTSGLYSYFPVNGTSVYVGYQNEIRRYSIITGGMSTPLYTSSSTSWITSLAADASSNLYFIQQQVCTPACPGTYTLYRLPNGTSTAQTLYFPLVDPVQTLHNLQISDGYLFFIHTIGTTTSLKRIRTDADIVPLTNLRITGMEINQSIQSDTNSVPLIQGKRTVARLLVQSDGGNIPGVFARLYRVDGSGATIAGPVYPINLDRSTTYLNVQSSPDRDNSSHSFLFFLPPDWVDDPTLRLRAELNPFEFPPEPNYSDNSLVTTTFNLQASGRLEIRFILFEYDSGGMRFRPDYTLDFLQTVSWVRRAYPLASAPGFASDPSPGFRPSMRRLFSEALGGNVDGTNRDPDCQRRIDLDPGEEGYLDDPSLCAAWYVVCPMMDVLRAEDGLDASIFQYGMTPDDAGFPRGWACGTNTAGPSGRGSWGWDFDNSYADWYGGHEIGHSLGRAHPTPGSAECGHSASDPAFPWPLAAIGDATLRGFDLGDPGLNSALTPRLYPSSTWTDMMGYCANQWISDYTYNALRTRLAPTSAALQPDAPAVGPYLQLSGVLYSDVDLAEITQLRIWPDLAHPPAAPTPGAYRIRLKNSGGSVLASYDFTPTEGGEYSAALNVSEFVTLPAGTRRAEIVKIAGDVLLWSRDISANSPLVSGVQLAGSPNPVSGSVTLQWTASDADGDPLAFDVLYSPDDGANWQHLMLGIGGSSVVLDTSELPGSTQGRFKVVAHDGANQGEGPSPAYNVTAKPPLITVLNPLDGLEINFGQELVFSAEVFDLQDGSPDPADIEWRDQTNYLLGTGTEFSTWDFLTGENIITVSATNSFGLTGSATFTIYVVDELELPGPTLAAAPDQVTWQLAPDQGGLQMAVVEVDNTGSGTLDISFSENAPWLAVSASASSAPAALTLTANPSGLLAGQYWTTILTISGGGQSVEIPVSLVRGYPRVPAAMNEMIYLPAVRR